MGAVSAYLAASVGVDTTPPVHALDRLAYRELKDLQDFDIPASCVGADEVQSIAIYTDVVSGGTFTLTITLANGESFETGDIAFDAVAATIETAIDTAATTAAITGWTDGDISVSGGPLTAAPVVLTFDGDSVAGTHHQQVVVDGTSLVGDGDVGAVTFIQGGQPDRPGYAVLMGLGIFKGTVPLFGDGPTLLTALAIPAQRRLSPDTIKAIAQDIAIAEGNPIIYDALVGTAGL